MKNAGKLEILSTPDGSYTLLNKELGETYHSKYGAITESKHVFIEAGLSQLATQESVQLLEVGFGTGLNAWLTAKYAIEKNICVNYVGLEPFPLASEYCKMPELGSSIADDKTLWDWIHSFLWDLDQQLNSHFSLFKITQGIAQFTSENNFFDLVYFDAFAPNYQPEMWELSIFQKLFSMLKKGGILVTYCSKGQVRRTLQETGFMVEKLPGPPHKREMLRARKMESEF